MTALPLYPTCIGWGIASALGPSARHTGFYLRAGRNNFTLSPFVDDLGDSVTMSCMSSLAKHLSGPDRLFALASLAIGEALDSLAETLQGQRVQVCVALPTRYASGRSLTQEGLELVRGLRERTALAGYRADVVPFAAGGGAGARAVTAGAGTLAANQADVVVLLGIDSYYEWSELERLGRAGRLLTPDNLDGLRPGEAAACLVLTAPAHPAARNGGVSQIVSAGEGHEPSRPGVDEPPNMAQGFSSAFRTAVAPLREQGLRTSSWISDMTHESYRVREFQILIARFGDVAASDLQLQTPARELGEVGAASLPLYAALATEAWYRGYAVGGTALCFAASDDGLRGALLLQTAQR